MKRIKDAQPAMPLLLWLIPLYIWAIFSLWSGSSQQCINSTQATKSLCTSLDFVELLSTHSLSIVALTGLVALHGGCFWLARKEKIAPRLAWPYLVVQAVLILLLGAVIGNENFILLIYLALILGATGMLPQARATLIVASLLFIAKALVSTFAQGSWDAFLDNMRVDSTAPLFMFVVGYLVLYIQQGQLYEKLQKSHAALEEANTRLEVSTRQITILTRQNERQRLAREWHDTLAQNLLSLIRQLDVAKSHLAHQRSERASEIVSETAASARLALAQARAAISDLRTNVPTPETLREMVQQEIERFTDATGIICVAELDALPETPPACCEHVLRTITEGLNNIARHAQANHVWITLVRHAQELELEIRDDGIGLPDLAAIGSGHYGLVGLRERARQVMGQFEIQSVPGQGTLLAMTFPTNAEEVEA
ncbi:sensor histidine kinase [Dictyobacter kobayashii]|uniref:histidine kinase n=1 Tax=Dictyobacter kobayashii TaxID=2014872 RepID=A0A402AQU5_9CHLR|nr:histidine kinase [Dictyobacter kobayashii]GCE21468.1 sensor histidine kinase YdfH [Dictyobacter kobayashii]